MGDAVFPIMGDIIGDRRGYVPFSFMKQFEQRAQRNHCQSIKRLTERGGLSPREALSVVNDLPYDHYRWPGDDTAWAILQAFVSAEYPGWNFDQNQRKD